MFASGERRARPSTHQDRALAGTDRCGRQQTTVAGLGQRLSQPGQNSASGGGGGSTGLRRWFTTHLLSTQGRGRKEAVEGSLTSQCCPSPSLCEKLCQVRTGDEGNVSLRPPLFKRAGGLSPGERAGVRASSVHTNFFLRFMGSRLLLTDLLTALMSRKIGAPASGTARRRPLPTSRAGRPALRFMGRAKQLPPSAI